MGELKEKLGESKKMLVLFGGVVVFGVYMLWPTDGEVPVGGGLDGELAALQAERANTAPKLVNPYGTNNNRNNNRNAGVGGGSDTEDGASFETGSPDLTGVLVGFGTHTDVQGEYLVAFIKNSDGDGYEVDLRAVTKYSTTIPFQWKDADKTGQQVSVYGVPSGAFKFKARSIR